jgi:calcium-dependent protein kinase
VAVKTIPKRRVIYVEMLRNEISILQSLNTANIVKLYDQFEDEKQVHLVFELCTGGELFEPIANQSFRFTERQAARLVRKMLEAVKYCHDRNIVHRDLKPENMLLSNGGVDSDLKVIDFGLATHIRIGEALTRHVGTPYYIAPEVLDKKYGKPCDLWSLGVITFTVLCGFPPFWGDTEREIYSRIRRGFYAFEGPDWARRSPHSKDFIQKLLTMNPKRRMTADEALVHPWILCEGEVIDPRSKKIVCTCLPSSLSHTFPTRIPDMQSVCSTCYTCGYMCSTVKTVYDLPVVEAIGPRRRCQGHVHAA